MKRVLRYLSSLDDILTLQGCQYGGYCKVVLRDRSVILGGSIANWSFVCFVGIGLVALVLVVRQVRGR